MFWRKRKSSGKSNKYRQLIVGAILVVLIPLGLASLRRPDTAKAAWFDDTWTYRKYIAITDHTAAENNVYAALTLDTATLITAGKMQSDCGDLRYTQQDGKLLKYYVSNCNNASSSIHVFFPTFPAGAQTIYYYYGNSRVNNGFESADFSTEAANYTVGSTSSEENTVAPVAYWSLDDASGVVAKNSIWQKTNSTTTNLITNPSFETNTTSWAVQGSGISFARSSTQAMFGSWSSAVTWTSNDSHYLEYAVGASPSTAYSLTMYVYSPTTNGCFNVWDWNGSSGTAQNTACPTVLNTWQKITITLTTQSDTNVLLVRFLPNTSTSSGTAYVDGVQVEKVSSPTNYCDGSLVGNGSRRWSGTAHASTSVCDNGTDGFILNGSWQTADQCVAGGCQKFNGTSTAIQTVTTVAGVKTVSMWVRPTSVTSTALIDLNGTARVTASSGTISATGFTSPTIYVNGVVSSTLVANQWQLVTVTTGTALTASAIKIGNYSTTYFSGFIDDVKMYPNARSAAQIKTDYNSRGSVKGSSASLGGNTETMKQLSNWLVGYWKMDEASGDATDYSGNSFTGTATGTTVIAGKFGNGRTFNGTSDRLTISDNSSLDPSSQISFGGWFKFTNTTQSSTALISKTEAGGYSIYLNHASYTNQIASFIHVNGQYYSVKFPISLLNTTDWFHIMVTFDGTTHRIYLNGALQDSTAGAGTITATSEPVVIGAEPGSSGTSFSSYFAGSEDEVRIYNRGLSPADVSNLYTFAPGPVGYWKLDENTGTVANDSSGNGNEATLTNTPTWTTGKYGAAVNFAGSNQHITRTDDADFDFADDADMSFEAWFKHGTQTSGTEVILSKFNEAGYKITMETDGDIQCGLDYDSTWTPTDSAISTAATYDDNLWHHVACVKSGASSLSIYIDGILITTDSSLTATNTLTNSDPLYIGIDADGTSNDFIGKIDEPKIYNYARTQKQIVEDMNAGHPAVGSPVGSAVGHWKFDEGADNMCSGGTNDACNSGSGGSAIDGAQSGMASPATAASGWTSSGKFNKALQFDGTNDFVTVSSNTALDAADSYTLTAWIRLDQLASTKGSSHVISSKVANSAGNSRTFYAFVDSANDKLTWIQGNGSGTTTATGTTTISATTWYHVAFVLNNALDQMSIYVNGKPEGNPTTFSSNPSTNAASLQIGAVSGVTGFTNTFMDGTIDEFKLYNYALTTSELAVDMNRGSSQVLGALSDKSTYQPQAANQEYCVPGDSASCAPPVGEWKFDEKQGTTAKDTSGNGFTGTLTGSPSPIWASGKIGGGLTFNGSSNYLVIGNMNKSLYTYETWFKIGTAITSTSIFGTVGVFVDNPDHANKWIVLGVATGACTNEVITIVDTITNGRTCVTDITIPAGWNHIAIAYDTANSEYKIYLNGVLQTSTPGTAVDVTLITISNFNLAYVQSIPTFPDSYTGYTVDLTRIFDYSRSAAQIAWDYNRGAPVGHWKFDECQGTTAYDDSRNANGTTNGNNGTWNGTSSGTQTSAGTCSTSSTAWGNGASGKFNASLNFDGTDDYVNINITNFKNPSSAITVSTWVNISTHKSWNNIVSRDNWNTAGKNSWILFTRSDGTVGFGVSNGTTLYQANSTTALSTGTWYHLLGTYDGTTVTLYVNGVPAGTNSVSGLTFSTITNLAIGSVGEGNNNFTSGQIDDVQIYNYALTATQIKNLQNQGAAIRFGPVTGTP